MGEQWARIIEAPSYEICTDGRIRNKGTGRILKLRENRQGVKMVSMRDAGITITRSVSALQKRAFGE